VSAQAQTSGPVVFAYDGSDLAKLAIKEAGRLLGPGRDAIALTVWKPFDVGFLPVSGVQFDAQEITAVERAAQETAEQGAELAKTAGFRARSWALEATPSWKGIVDFAEEREAGVIVLGSHGRSGLAGALVGSVAGAVASHSRRSVLIVHRQG
jgi:nucleotide-binding universal stress UspA family protein